MLGTKTELQLNFIHFSDGTGSLLHRQDMTPYGWRYTWAAKFNSSTTLLLVAGVIDDVDGSLAIFQVSSNDVLSVKVN